jgi:hypothetical protein
MGRTELRACSRTLTVDINDDQMDLSHEIKTVSSCGSRQMHMARR